MHIRVVAAAAAILAAAHTFAGTVRDLVRIKGQGESIIQGVGLVTALPGTGDSGKELAMARPLAKLLENNGATLGSLKEIEKSRSVALVIVTCVIPENGAYADDKIDVTVSVVNSATSLEGGQLFLTPLKGPFVGDPTVYAMAEGPCEIEGQVKTRARVRGGARLMQDVLMASLGDTFDLIIDRPFAEWSAATQIAVAINAKAQPIGPPVARAIDDRTVRITVPPAERSDRAGFIADVLAAEVNLNQLDLAATVIYNARKGAIIVGGDVEISPVAITHNNLSITTVTPALQPTPQNPLVRRDRWTGMETNARPSEKSRLTDLLAAFKQLDIPPADQIAVIEMLHRMGKLHAKIIRE